MEPSLSIGCGVHADGGLLHPDALGMNLQRMLVNQMILDRADLPTAESSGRRRPPGHTGPADDARRAALRHHERRQGTATRQQDRLAHAGQGGRHHHPRRHAINVAPLNQVPGAVVSLMERTNVETVIVAGKVRKWKGKLLDVDLPQPAQAARGLARLHLRSGGHPAGPVPV